MDGNLMAVQDIFLDKMNQICSKFGLNTIMAQLYAILYLSDNPLSLDDMVERLKISKGSASVNIRALQRYGTVKKVWVKGSRKDYYVAEADIGRVILERIRSMVNNRLSEVDDMLSSSYRMLESTLSKESKDEEVRTFTQKLEKLRELHNQAKSIFDLFNSDILNSLLNEKAKKPEALVTE